MSPPPTESLEQDHPLLDLDVMAWRYDCLVRVGYPVEAASELAGKGEIDLHDAVDLLQRGCPVEQALAILT